MGRADIALELGGDVMPSEAVLDPDAESCGATDAFFERTFPRANGLPGRSAAVQKRAACCVHVAGQQLPAGMEILQVHQMPLEMPSLQSQMRFAVYRVELETGKERPEVESAIADLLSREELPWQHQRDTGPHHYDLRKLIADLWLMEWQEGRCVLGMKLRCDGHGAGRPEQVAIALGFEQYPRSVHRTRLVLQAR